MKVFVEHDAKGNIQFVAAPHVGSILRVVPQPRPSYFVSEVEAPDVSDARDIDRLREIKRDHRVEGHPDQPRLVRRT